MTTPNTLAAWEHSFLTKYGRKFALALVVIVVGFVVHLLGMLAIVAVTHIDRAREITVVVEAFREVIIAAIVCFTGADAWITTRTARLEADKAGPGPTRPSGTITAHEGGV